jgi:hypothetical protein
MAPATTAMGVARAPPFLGMEVEGVVAALVLVEAAVAV